MDLERYTELANEILHNPDIIYYNLWDCQLPSENTLHGWLNEYMAKALYNPDRYLFVTNIQVNNKYFIEHLENWNSIRLDWKTIADRLDFMLNDYAQRRSIIDNNSDTLTFKIDWFENTILMCGDGKQSIFKQVVLWCNERLALLKRNVAIATQDAIQKPQPQEPQPSPSVQATAKDDTALPDYPHMESYTPTIPFDMSALYTFLKDEGVIRDIDEPLFADCITHANMNELFNHGVKSKLRLVISHLKKHFPKNWYNSICLNFGCSKQEMGKFNVPTRKDFERKMKMLR